MINESGVPALLFEADHNDARDFSEEQAYNRIDAFLEMLDA
jgi:benzoyl-CoA reductase/2-hydroxyglutaryl-CoA dehydratase subunit BcrC/BadD/HgdB